MATSQIIKLGAVNRKKTTLLEALRHNRRELQEERGAPANIDASRSNLNYALHGDGNAQTIANHARIQMFKAGIEEPRANAVMAVEVLFSLPIDRHQHDTRSFFHDCYEWVKATFCAGELLSFDVHLDEAAPHAHAMILPLVEGKMQGNAMLGGRGNLKRIDNLFFEQVASKHGLSKRDYKRLNAANKGKLAKDVLKRLNGDSVRKSAIWAWVRDAITADPIQCAEILGIEISVSPKKQKHFVDIARSRGKGKFET
jgi:hypothetical protein